MSFYDYLRNLRMSDLSTDINFQNEKINNVKLSQSLIEQSLNGRINKLTLVLQAMWSIIEEKTDLTEADLMKKIHELDMSDGRLDSKAGGKKVTCPECDAAINTSIGKCQFCGHQLETGESGFEYK